MPIFSSFFPQCGAWFQAKILMGDHCRFSLSFSPLALVSPFVCYSRVTSRNSLKWRACSRAEELVTQSQANFNVS